MLDVLLGRQHERALELGLALLRLVLFVAVGTEQQTFGQRLPHALWTDRLAQTIVGDQREARRGECLGAQRGLSAQTARLLRVELALLAQSDEQHALGGACSGVAQPLLPEFALELGECVPGERDAGRNARLFALEDAQNKQIAGGQA